MWWRTGLVQSGWKAFKQWGTAEEWRWRTLAVRTAAGMELDLISQVSSRYLSLLLSPLCPITVTMRRTRSCGATYGRLVVKSFTDQWSYAVIDRYSTWKTQRAAEPVCFGRSFSQHDFLQMLAGHQPDSLLMRTIDLSTVRGWVLLFFHK